LTSTKYRERGVSSPTVQTGNNVQVTGTQAGAGTVNATLVVIGTPGRGHHGGHGGSGPGGGNPPPGFGSHGGHGHGHSGP
jgi:hypothetical protein